MVISPYYVTVSLCPLINTPWGVNERKIQKNPNLTKPFLDPIFDVEPVFEVRFDSK